MKKELSEVNGFENCKGYFIYDDGRLYTPHRKRFMKPSVDSNGYLFYDLRRTNSLYKCPKVHRLVMLAFSSQEQKEEINHIDGNKKNNKLSNLEWVTHKENRIHAINNNLTNEVKYGIAQYDLQGNLIKIYDTCREALICLGKNKNISGNIGRCIRGKRKTAYGYIWKQYEGSTTIPKGSTLK